MTIAKIDVFIGLQLANCYLVGGINLCNLWWGDKNLVAGSPLGGIFPGGR